MTQMLTKAQQDQQITAATLTGAARYSTQPRTGGGWSARDHENAEWLTDLDGRETFDNWSDAHDLEMEHRG